MTYFPAGFPVVWLVALALCGARGPGRDVELGRVYRLGLRITPTVDLRPRAAQQGQVTKELETAASNPLSFLTNVFSSLLSDGMFTIELEVEPSEALFFTLDAIQRTSGGFFGTGIGFASPMRTGGPQGVTRGSPRAPRWTCSAGRRSRSNSTPTSSSRRGRARAAART